MDAGSAYIGAGVIVLAVVALARTLLLDRSAFNQQEGEIRQLRSDVANLSAKVEAITGLYEEQRSQKHKALNDIAKCVMALHLIYELSKDCTCNALAKVDSIVVSLLTDLSPSAQRVEPGEGL
jgi:hypothetical protein